MRRSGKFAAEMFKALADENRLKILKLLCGGEKCACVLLRDLRISQPTLSHHMRILCDSGIVAARKEGRWMHYSISPQGAETAVTLLRNLVTVSRRDPPCPCNG